ncbi:hypothetical protein [Roseateles aquatilis]|uniref:hypothetical protein n=1 Tax=Roseateles aquatilis TaxID=431061 RepID=UPI00192CFDAC|nr:hypothetical protein [Roseateles aquatilis]
MTSIDQPEWVTRGKAIRQLIAELQSFENQEMMVEISLDDGYFHKPISLVKKSGKICLLVNSEILCPQRGRLSTRTKSSNSLKSFPMLEPAWRASGS